MEQKTGTTWAPRDRREVERRREHRRRHTVAVTVDRRRLRDRRKNTRRSGQERRKRSSREVGFAERRLTPLPFSFEQATGIKERALAGTDPGLCPICQGSFAVGPPVSRLAETIREYRCRDCHRAVMVSQAKPI